MQRIYHMPQHSDQVKTTALYPRRSPSLRSTTMTEDTLGRPLTVTVRTRFGDRLQRTSIQTRTTTCIRHLKELIGSRMCLPAKDIALTPMRGRMRNPALAFNLVDPMDVLSDDVTLTSCIDETNSESETDFLINRPGLVRQRALRVYHIYDIEFVYANHTILNLIVDAYETISSITGRCGFQADLPEGLLQFEFEGAQLALWDTRGCWERCSKMTLTDHGIGPNAKINVHPVTPVRRHRRSRSPHSLSRRPDAATS